MIVARINSGLGNQMFQHAMARHLALLNKTTVQWDISYYEKDHRRSFALNHFHIGSKIADRSQFAILKQRRPRWRHELYALFNRLRSPKRKQLRLIKERHFHFDPEVLSARGNLYLDGYWQSEKYFLPSEQQVRDDLKFKTEPNEINKSWRDQITGGISLGVHVRRGDYVSNPQTLAFHGACSIEYYKKAAKHISDRVALRNIFVFSDDPAWARENLDLGRPFHVIDNNKEEQHFEDLRLLSHCHHHVIANSTFGWWGAWLGEAPGQIVVAPEHWTQAQNHDARDVVPERWIRM